MKWCLSLILLFGCLHLFAQQSEVKGIISIFNSKTSTGKRAYVVNAQVMDDFSKAQPVITDLKGQFKLTYVGVNEKETVSFHVRSPGLEVVNTDALTAIAGQFDLKQISMANKDSIVAYRLKIYQIGREQALKYLDNQQHKRSAELAGLRKNAIQNKKTIDSVEHELASLNDKRTKVDEQAEGLAKRYATINLDDASALFRKAFLLFQHGDIDSSLLILSHVNTQSSVDSILLEKNRIAGIRASLKQRDSVLDQRTKDKGSALLLEADLHETRYEFKKADNTYRLLLKLDSLNGDYFYEYADFLSTMNNFDQSIKYFSIALKIYRTVPGLNDVKIARTLNELGEVYIESNEFSKSEASYLEAVEIYRRLYSAKQSDVIESYLAQSENSLGILYREKNDFVKAKTAYLESLNIRKKLASKDPSTYELDLAVTLDHLGNFYRHSNDIANAEPTYLEALAIRKRLVKRDSSRYESGLAQTQGYLGLLYEHMKQFQKAEEMYKNALEITKRLAANNPFTYDRLVAEIENNMAIVYYLENDFDKAETLYLDALGIWQRLAKDAPIAYASVISIAENNLADMYSDEKDFEKAGPLYQDALKLLRSLVKVNPDVYDPDLALTLNSLGIYYYHKKDFENARATLRESLKIRKILCEKNFGSYGSYLANTQYSLGFVYLHVKDYLQADSLYSDALITVSKLQNKNLQSEVDNSITIARSLLDLYNQMIDSSSYDTFKAHHPDHFARVEDALLIQSKKDLDVNFKLADYYGRRSWCFLFASRFKEAQLSAEKGLSLDPTQIWIKVNLGHSLLFQERYNDALKVYQSLKNLKDADGNSYVKIIGQDFNDLEKQGISNKDVHRVRAVLTE